MTRTLTKAQRRVLRAHAEVAALRAERDGHNEQPWTAQAIRDYFAEYPSLEEAAAAIADEWNQNNEYTDIVRAERDAMEAKWESVPWDTFATILADHPVEYDLLRDFVAANTLGNPPQEPQQHE